MTQSMGHQARFAVDAATPFDGLSEWIDIKSENLQKKAVILDTDTVMGTRSHIEERTRAGVQDISGTINMIASPALLDNWLPRILGGAESVDSFPLAETLPEFAALIDRVADVYLYEHLKVNKATFRGTTGSNFVELDIDVVGKTETKGQTWPAALTTAGLDIAANNAPYVFTDGVLTLQAGAREFTEFELAIDNKLNVDFRNSVTATDIDAGDREVTLTVKVPAISGNADLYDQALAGAAGTLVFTNGTYSTTFTFGTLQVPSQSPVIEGKGPILHTLTMIARKTGSTDELVVTNVTA